MDRKGSEREGKGRDWRDRETGSGYTEIRRKLGMQIYCVCAYVRERESECMGEKASE